MSKAPRTHAAPAAPPAPAPLVAPPQPMGLGVLRVQKQMYREWLAAGGAPIYQPITPPTPATKAKLFGGGFTDAEEVDLLAALKALTNASFAVTVDGTPRQVTPMNLTAVADLPAVATAIGTGLTGGDCSWSGSCFVVSSDTAGALSTLTYAVAPASGTDISTTAKLTAATGAVLDQGDAAVT